jgi:hypothetical protein
VGVLIACGLYALQIAAGHLCALAHLGPGTDRAADGQVYNLSSGSPIEYRR